MVWRALVCLSVIGACILAAACVNGGAEGGPARVSRRIDPYDSISDRRKFKGRERASVLLEGAGNTDLDLYVFDEQGNLIAWDDSPLDGCAVEWYPEKAARYSIEVRNTGPMIGEAFIMIR
jgi:hypothetical protein